MPSLGIPAPIRSQILPEYRIPLNRLKSDTRVLQIPPALDKFTPFLIRWHLQPWEIGAAAGTGRVQVDHEGRYSVTSSRGSCPVVVVRVVAGDTISLAPQPFDEEVWSPTLE